MPPIGPIAKRLMIVAVGAFVLQMVLQVWVGVPVFELLVLRGGPLGVDDLWRFVGHVLVWPPAPGSVMSLAFTCLGLWWMVTPIEQEYGPRRAWQLVALALACAAVPARLVGVFLPGSALFGLGPVFLAAIAVYAFTLGDQMVRLFGVLPLRAKHLLYLALAFVGLSFLVQPDVPRLVADLGAVGAGWWFVRGRAVMGRRGGRRAPARGRRGNLRVVPKDDEAERPRWLN